MKEYRSANSVAFSRRRNKLCACIVDSKHHIRSFIRDALEELDLLTYECVDISELDGSLKTQMLDLVMLGPSGCGKETADTLRALAESRYDSKVLLLGFDAEILTKIQELGDKNGLAMLPALPTPFGSGSLRDRVVMLRSATKRNAGRSGIPRTCFLPKLKLIVNSSPARLIAQ